MLIYGVQSHNLNFATFASAIILYCLWPWISQSILHQMSKSRTVSKSSSWADSETILDFRNYYRIDQDIQDQRHHIIIAPAEVAKLKSRDCTIM